MKKVDRWSPCRASPAPAGADGLVDTLNLCTLHNDIPYWCNCFSFSFLLVLLTWRPFVSQNICFPSGGRSSRGGSARLTGVHLVLEMLTKRCGDFVTWLLRWDGCDIEDLFRFPTPPNVSESNKGSFLCVCVVILFMFDDAKSFSDARETRFKRR